MNSEIKVTFDQEMIHRWNPEIVGKEPPAGQGYLKYPHRHIFKWTVCFKQTESREIEFIQAKALCRGVMLQVLDNPFLVRRSCEEEHKAYTVYEASCEDFAVAFMRGLAQESARDGGQQAEKLFGALASVEVSEDGENGAVVYFRT